MGCVLGAIARSAPSGTLRGPSLASLDGCAHPGRALVSVLVGLLGCRPPAVRALPFPWVFGFTK